MFEVLNFISHISHYSNIAQEKVSIQKIVKFQNSYLSTYKYEQKSQIPF